MIFKRLGYWCGFTVYLGLGFVWSYSGHVAPDVPVYELDMAVINIVPHVRIVMKICGASPVNLQPKPQKLPKRSVDSDLDEDDVAWEAQSNSSCEVVASDVESGVEDAAAEEVQNAPESEGETPDNEDEIPAREKLPAGTHVIFNNGYFTLVNYAKCGKHTDCKMIICPRFCTSPPFGMGSTGKSKTVQILSYDTNIQRPHRSYIVLRCWALHRASQAGWLEHSSARQRWHRQEVLSVRQAIADLQCLGFRLVARQLLLPLSHFFAREVS